MQNAFLNVFKDKPLFFIKIKSLCNFYIEKIQASYWES